MIESIKSKASLLSTVQKLRLLRICIGIVFLWFGMLKFFPGISPAEGIAGNTIHALTFGMISPALSVLILAVMETIIGLMLIAGLFPRTVIVATIIHILFTFSPLFIFPELSFSGEAMGLTLLGQYIMKNIIIISALFVVYPPKVQEKGSAKTLENEDSGQHWNKAA